MVLYLAGEISAAIALAKLIQFGIEYDPPPPFNSGSPDKIPAEILNKMLNKNTDK